MSSYNGLIDLHVHLDGSLSPDTVRYLADMQNISLIEGKDNKDISTLELDKKLKINENCHNLKEYLEKFDFTLPLLQSEWSIEQSVYRLLKEQSYQGLIYSEIRFAPQLHTRNGLSMRKVVLAALKGLAAARQNLPIGAALILCCMRGKDNAVQNEETIKLAAEFKNSGVAAVDLAGDEYHFKTDNYQNIFSLANKLNVAMTIHAGEADGPESIRMALKCGAKRIGHGIAMRLDKDVRKMVRAAGTGVEMCPISNLQTKAVQSTADYPIGLFLDEGLLVSVNTDNRTVSNTSLTREFDFIQKTYGVTDAQVLRIIQNAADTAFADDDMKQKLYKKLVKA